MSARSTRKPRTRPNVVLLVEDNENDILLFTRAFKAARTNSTLHVVRDGTEAVAYLSGQGKFADRNQYPLPDLMLLDLKMPRMDGFQVLQWARRQPELTMLCIVVLTTSDDLPDVNLAYELGANSFLTKSGRLRDFTAQVAEIKKYWLGTTTTPDCLPPPADT